MAGILSTGSSTIPERELGSPCLSLCGGVNIDKDDISTRKILPGPANIHQFFNCTALSRIGQLSRLQCTLTAVLFISTLLLVHGLFDYTSPTLVAAPSTEPRLVTSPLIFSEFSLSTKYLLWTNEVDITAGVDHRFHSWGCALGEAVILNRTYVFPARFKVPSRHNHWRPGVKKDTRLYINLPLLHRKVRLIEETYFHQEWEKRLPASSTLTQLDVREDITTSSLISNDSGSMFIRRGMDRTYMYAKCYPCRFNVKGMDWVPLDNSEYAPVKIPVAPYLVDVAELIKRKLGANYCVVHVRRGDKMGVKHPTLNNDTQPEELKKRLPKWIPRGSNVYIASNEDTPHFFDPLKELYVLSILSDFRNFWEEGSEWWNQTSHLFEASDVERFDGMMAGMVDYVLMRGASILVHTFGMLSPGNRHITTANDIRGWQSNQPGQK